MLASITLIITLFTFAKSATVRPYTETTHEVEAFKKLKLEGVFHVTLKQGSKNQVVVNASERLQSKVQVEEKKGELYVHMKNRKRNNQFGKIEITIIFTQMEELETAFVGSLASDGILNMNELDWNNASVGDVDLKLNVSQFKVNNSAVGQVTLAGRSDKASISNSMVGDFYAKNFIVETLVVENSSVGQCTIYADKELSILHSGTGSFYYYGDAKVVSMSSTGIGRVKKED